MSETAVPKRFWTTTSVTERAEGFGIALDGRPVRTPLKRELEIPTRALADAISAEWNAQGEKVDPGSMPLTRYMNSVVDSISDNREAIVDTVAAYADTDMLCYRATHPQPLIEKQASVWDAYLTWVAQAYGAPMVVTQGILPVEQPEATLTALRQRVTAHDDTSLAALHDLTALSGSLVLALAVSDEHVTPEVAWSASRVDENWQVEQWGEDDLATTTAERKRGEFANAARLLMLSRKQ